MKEKWIVRGGRAQPIVEKYGMAPFIARILAGRLNGHSVEEFIDRERPIDDPCGLKDAKRAADILESALSAGKKICIVGDYDVDGMTSTAILYLGIKHFVPEADIIHRIPERITDGYGFGVSIAEELLSQGVSVALTCDNGIREFETARFLKEKGVTLVVTDHHAIALDEEGEEVLPEADAIVNPHRKGDEYPDKNICGAFVAYLLIRLMAIRRGMDPEQDRVLLWLKGYAAMGTICDVMPLEGNNRRLVYQGLRSLQKDPTVGVAGLMQASSVKELTPYTVGFSIGPMINAGGRLGSQNRYFDIMISDSRTLCRRLASELYNLNKTRQMLTEQGIKEGQEQAEFEKEDMIKVIYLPELHESIAGLVAGKLRESLNRPVFVATKGMEGIKGSGRSIEAYSMFEAMDQVSDIFDHFGGHAMAAGFSLKAEAGHEAEAIRNMKSRLNEKCRLTEEDCLPIVYIDSTMEPGRITVDLVRELEMIAPYGTGNPEPLLAVKEVELVGVRLFGKKGNFYDLTLEKGGVRCFATCFDQSVMTDLLMDAFPEEQARNTLQGSKLPRPITIDMVYQARIDDYYGKDEVRILVKHLRISESHK